MNAERCCVVGGGVLGLAMARDLSLNGMRVSLWEGSAELGGLASSWQIGSAQWDRFYHVVTSNDELLLDLLRTLGLESEMRWSCPQTGFYAEGRLHRFSSVLDFLNFPPLNPIDKLRLGTTILRAAAISDPLPLERITAVQWLTQLCGPKVVERIWLPLLRAKLGVNAQRVNAAFIWAIIARMYGARQGDAKRELFGYVPGGYRRVLGRLSAHLQSLGVEVASDRRVDTIAMTSDGGVAVTAGERTEIFDRVVVTVPAPAAAAMCPDLLPIERKRLVDVEYQGVVCASLLLKRPLSPYYITNITDPMPFTAVIEMDALVDPTYLGGYALVYLPKYLPSDDPYFELDDETIRREFIAALNAMHPNFGMNDVLAFRVARARHVLPISTLDYSERIPAFTTMTRRIHVVNSTQIVNGTLNVNQTLGLGKRALADILEHRSTAVPRGEAQLV